LSALAHTTTAELLIQRARALAPFLTEHSPEADELRRLPDTVVDALRDAELLSLGPPAALGGHGVELDTMLEVAYEIGRGCTSTGWCWQIWTLHAWFTGYLSREGQAEVFADGGDTIIASGYNPAGSVVTRADGGWNVSGRWTFSSGIDHATWVLLGINTPDAAKSADSLQPLVLVPREQVKVIDNWYVIGLKGTGSKGLAIEEPVFVPDHLVLDMTDAEKGPARARFDRPSYGAPPAIGINFVSTGPFIGAARAAVDAFAAEMAVGRDSLTAASKASKVALQMRIGESVAELDAAMNLARTGQRELLELGARQATLTPEQRATYRLHQCYCIELSRRAITRLYEVSGTATMFSTSSMWRRFSDIHAGAKHFTARWDEYAESYGRVRLGLEANAILR
jgi:3-hydroxy-9,10-secoandrosta-1,3,5(10)-triene-9,17-dione monooxygenase